MDGYAVQAQSTEGANPATPVILNCDENATYLDTGDPLPSWANAIIPIENVEPLDENGNIIETRHPPKIRIRTAVPPWQHVRPMGEDIVATQLVLPAGHVLQPVDLGAIAASGYDKISIYRKPRVTIIPTGTELVPIGKEVKTGEIIEYNSLVMAAQVISWGGEVKRSEIIPDDFKKIFTAVREASENCDLILLNAGSSAGSEDFSARVVESMGSLIVHGVAVRPGHPVILGTIRSEANGLNRNLIPIIGVPGYPVSAALTAEIFVKPLVALWTGRQEEEPETISATLTRKITSPAGDDDYLRVAIGKVGDRILAAPLSRGAGVITSLVQADGITVVPRGSQGLPAGVQISVRLLKPRQVIDQTIFIIGSHDMTLDLMAQFLAAHRRRIVSANVGSLAGLVALQRKEAHLAGSHLLDTNTGEYNESFLQQYLPDVPVKLITLVGRQQGLMVSRGNPRNIQSLEDLIRPDVVFINRQRGSGTRVLLDYHLGLSGIASEQIQGYNQDEYTHLTVAAAVASGRASCGLGIAAAARALDLDFIPLFQERYDLVIPFEHYQSVLLEPLLDVLHSITFKKVVEDLAGYDTSQMGKIVGDFHN
jgi:putative molybdopterin biosynthesis protein